MDWTNISTQSLQPTFASNFYQLGPKKAIEILKQGYSTDMSYNGGGCMKVTGKISKVEDLARTVFR